MDVTNIAGGKRVDSGSAVCEFADTGTIRSITIGDEAIVADNEAPLLTPLVTQTPHGQPLTINLAAQASDVDQDPLFFVCCDAPQGGSVAIDSSAEGTLSVTFTPNDGFDGEASFSYSADDQQGHLVSGSVTVVVLPPDNRPPVIGEGIRTYQEGSGPGCGRGAAPRRASTLRL